MNDISKHLIEQIQTARSEGRGLEIIGRGSKKFFGRDSKSRLASTSSVAAKDNIASVAGHSGIVSYEPVELVMTVRAGTSITEIEAALEEKGQMLSFEPPNFDGKASIGGTLACNLSGPARPWAGSVRDMVLGIRLINGKGEHLRFGGQVMKNVAGYDVSRMQAGALGSFGIISEVSLKVLPKTASSLTLVKTIAANAAIQLMNKLSGVAKPLTAACWLDGKLYLRLSGAQSAVDGTRKEWINGMLGESCVLEGAETFWRDLREHQLPFFDGDFPLWRFSLKPSAEHFFTDAQWLIDWGGAQRWLRGDSLSGDWSHASLEKTAVASSGQVNLYRGGDRSVEVFHEQPEALKRIHKRLKAAFDPDGLFNAGRLYSWL